MGCIGGGGPSTVGRGLRRVKFNKFNAHLYYRNTKMPTLVLYSVHLYHQILNLQSINVIISVMFKMGSLQSCGTIYTLCQNMKGAISKKHR